MEILIIEDNLADVFLIEEMIDGKSHSIYHCTRLQDAQELINRYDIDIILLDLGLPDSQGLDTFSRIKEISRNLPVVIMSNLDDDELALQSLRLGAQDYLPKSRIDSFTVNRVLTYAIERNQLFRLYQSSVMQIQALIDSSNHAYFLIDRGPKLKKHNAEARNLYLKFFNKNIIEDDSIKLLSKHIQFFDEMLNKCFQGSSVEEVFRLLMPDNKYYWLELRFKPILYPREDYSSVSLTIFDLTDKKEAEITRVESEIKFRIMFNESMDIILIINPETGKIISVNNTIETVLGYKKEEVIGKEIDMFFIESKSQSRQEILEKVKIFGSVFESLEVEDGSGKQILTDLTATTVPWEKSKAIMVTLRDVTERYQSELALKESENRFRSFFDQSQDGMLLTDEKGKIYYWNNTLEIFTGLKRKDVLDIPVWEALDKLTLEYQQIPTNFKEAVSDIILKGRSNKLRRIIETEIISPNGKIITIQMLFFPIRSAKGWLLGSIMRDLTEKKKSMELQFQLASLVEFSDDAIFGNALDGTIESWNTGAEKIYGYKSNEVIGKSFNILFPPEVTHELEEILDNIRIGMSIDHYETEQIRKDGHRLYVSLTVSPLLNAFGKITGASTIARDITQQKLAEESIKESERRLSNILNLSADGIISTDENLQIALFNDFAEKLFGYNEEEIINSNLSILLDNFSMKIIKEKNKIYINNELAEDEYNDPFEVTAIRKDKSTFAAEVSISMIKISEKIYYTAIFRDITDRKEAENKIIELNKDLEERVQQRTYQLENTLKELKSEIATRKMAEEKLYQSRNEIVTAYRKEKELNEMKSRFISMISHEYRTPLTVINASAELMEVYYNKQNNDKFNKHLNKIYASVENLVRIVEDVLIVGRIDSGRVEVEYEHINISMFAQELIEDNKSADKGNHSFKLDIEKNIHIDSDKKLLSYIINNLISNAIKYSPNNSVISIRVYQSGKFVHIEVKDEGIGIEEEEQKKIFEPFFRASNVGSQSGTGFGLSIVKGAIETLGGDIIIKSKLNEGSTFNIHLPLTKKGGQK